MNVDYVMLCYNEPAAPSVQHLNKQQTNHLYVRVDKQ